jgi:P27 family predicted phage terminase small subunit
MRGDKAQPAELKILRMTAKKAQALVAKTTPTPGPLLDPPDWFNDDQRTAWEYAIANAPQGVLKNIDRSALAGYIVAEDIHRQATLALLQSRLLIVSPKQKIALQNPYLPIVNRQFVLMLRAASELGFTPCSRARIDAGKPSTPAQNDWEDVTEAG